MVVAQLTGLSGETQVSNGGNSNVGFVGIEIKALDPGVFGLVLQLEGQGLVLEIGETGLGRDGGVAETASLERSKC